MDPEHNNTTECTLRIIRISLCQRQRSKIYKNDETMCLSQKFNTKKLGKFYPDQQLDIDEQQGFCYTIYMHNIIT